MTNIGGIGKINSFPKEGNTLIRNTPRTPRTDLETDLMLANAEVERLTKHSENLRLDYVDLLERAESAEAELKQAKAEICEICQAFSNATGHGWNGDCDGCKWHDITQKEESK